MTDTTPAPDAETIAWTTHLAGCDEAAWVVTVTGTEHAVATLHKKTCRDVASTIAREGKDGR
jgi:hypothetical protein